ncbi:hypothetical protein CCC_02462 [Paramagnetospirillum magnetotacticum MS-1]|uniref:Uncharacterized protein n=1 Tax=Paramagnetospirillum magnetotacticum MS-1 TaxID=272627 RepID=A0A0C2UBY7_PARME|nr:hypothetical protein [Paramagnetospirillum magnetotacticum]KIL99012.1 hypothetical protein CCC_02462 [Paramagnetospirillum magnetotacticum MS-1]
MSENELGARCRNTAAVAVKAFAGLLEQQAVDGQVPVETIRRLCADMGGLGDVVGSLYSDSEQSCQDIFALRQVDCQRTNYIGRIVTKAFAHILNDHASGITRGHLGRFFTALRMILGEEVYEEIQGRCAAIAAEAGKGRDGVTRWEAFYAHPETILLRERVLVSIARTFRRFEPRKDWLMIVMNSAPATRTIGGGVYLSAKPGKRCTDEFDDPKFLLIFEALFAVCDPKSMDDAGHAQFQFRWQMTPEAVFGPILGELARMRASLAA